MRIPGLLRVPPIGFHMRIAVVTPDIVEGDAVSNDVLGMARTLKQAGFDTHLGAIRATGVSEPVVPMRDLDELLTGPDDVLIYHHSIGSEEMIKIIPRLRCHKILKYHNITPPEFYRDLSPTIALVCEVGLEQLKPLLQMRPIVWVDSAFNGRDLLAIQSDLQFYVLPPFNQVHRLLESTPDVLSVDLFADWKTNVLVVGRVVPNKNVILAVEAFAQYHRRQRDSRLIVAGDIHPEYCRKVLKRIRELEMEEHVVVTGKVTLAQLKALYLSANMLLCTSKHEGFCLPLVEAMGLNVPMVALANTAIPDTAGDAAWYAKNDPGSIAEVMVECQANERERECKLAIGHQRYLAQFRNESIARRMLQLLESALSDMSYRAGARKFFADALG